ncbi:Spy/CpxP family protein refolding chaperone [Methylobacterium sp. R2-1]|uniref:Spy/CpxP family protein refolding chaperone n=1 Tax=Methylobacterium sp. R2-1 TaxID=2587064 RepID=UPI0017DABF89|nr:Spy/CpxP family protein refolding chaperone [Methylobacterium sp. R2-1]MBB2960159.1 zinc resistance-associated protein [Methylobacterium sp. R2-1]
MTRIRVTGLAMVGLAVLGAAGLGTAAVHAGERGGPFADGPHGHRYGRWSALSAEDRAAFTDARIAGLHAGLKLNPEQEKLWPPVEAALRDLSKQRDAQREARRDRGRMVDDAPGALRAMADAATVRGEALRKLADASTPLFATLDEGQKRRAMVLARPMRPFGGMHRHGPRHGDERD